MKYLKISASRKKRDFKDSCIDERRRLRNIVRVGETLMCIYLVVVVKRTHRYVPTYLLNKITMTPTCRGHSLAAFLLSDGSLERYADTSRA